MHRLSVPVLFVELQPTVTRLLFGLVASLGIQGFSTSVIANSQRGTEGLTAEPANDAAGPHKSDLNDMEEVVVTATRSKEAVNRVPVSVQAFTKEDMEKEGVRQFEDLVRLSPGLTFNNTFAGGTNIAIRGIGSDAGSATTGIYIDDVPIQVRNLGYSATSIFPRVFDLDRVEVLRGPQGTLFGAGSEGGAVRFIQPAPSVDKYESFTRAEIANTHGGAPSYELGEAGGGPIVPGALGFRVSAYLRHDGGFIDRVNGSNLTVVDPTGSLGGSSAQLNVTDTPYKNSNYENSGAFRLALRIEPNDALSITPSFFFQQQRLHDDIDSFWLSVSDPKKDQFAAPLFAQLPGYLNYTGEPNLNRGDNKIYLPAVELKWNLARLDAYSTTSFLVTHKEQIVDATTGYLQNYNSVLYPPAGYKAPDHNVDRDRNFTQEFRLQSADSAARFYWLVGAFYSHAEQYSEEDIHPNFFNTICCYFGIPNLENGQPFGPGSTDFENIWGAPLLTDSTSYYGEFRAVDDQIAGFSQISFKPIDRLTLTAGMRISGDAFKVGAAFAGPENNLNPPFGSPCPIAVCVFDAPGPWAPKFAGGGASTSETSVTPKYTIALQADATALYYGTISKGFRPGGGEVALPTVCDSELIDFGYVSSNGKAQAPLTYRSDSVWNYEIGSKSQLLDKTIAIDANAYLIKWRSVQSQIVLPVCGYAFTDNFGNATSDGFDLSAHFRPLSQMAFGVNVSNNRASFDRDFGNKNGSSIIFRNGEAIPQSGAPWNVSVLSDYQQPVFGRLIYGHADLTYASRFRRSISTEPGTVGYQPLLPPQGPVQQVNLRVGSYLGSVDLAIFVNNVFDKTPLVGLNQTHDPNAIGAAAIWTASTIRPRTAGLTFAYHVH